MGRMESTEGEAKTRAGLFLILALSWMMAGCSDDGPRRRLVTQVEASDSAGVSRVRILDLFALGIPDVTARKVWRANVSEFYEVRDAWIESGGSVLLANGGNAEVIRLSPAGEAVARLGSLGEGPGEFAQSGLNWIDGSREGRILTYDERLARITEFASNGTLLDTHRLSPPDYWTSLQPVALLSGRRILAFYGDIRRFDREGIVRDTLPLLSISFGGATNSHASDGGAAMDTLGLWPGLERVYARTPAGATRLPVGFANDVLYDGAGSVAAVSPSDEVDLRVFEEGRLIVTVEAAAPPRPVRAEDAHAYRRDLRARTSDSSMDELWSDPPVNEIYPTLDRVVVTQDGNIWVGIHPEYREDRRTFILLDRQGFPVGRLRLPKELGILGVDGDRVVVSTRTELDEERIEVWRIE